MPTHTRLDYLQQKLKRALVDAYNNHDEAELIVRWLLEDRLQLTASQLLAYPDFLVNQEQVDQLFGDLEALKAGWPPQYVIGWVAFLGHPLKVAPGVFIPRPETEELANQIIRQHGFPDGPILDVGAGTGCLAISLAKAFQNQQVMALESSATALRILQKNVEENAANVKVVQGDFLTPAYLSSAINQFYALIVSNPPYVTEQEKAGMAERVKTFEPQEALFVDDEDPLIFYRRLGQFASHYLCIGGKLAVEVNAAYAQMVATLFEQANLTGVSIEIDIQGTERFVYAFQKNQ